MAGFTGAAFVRASLSPGPVAFDASPHVMCEATGRLHRHLPGSPVAKDLTIRAVSPVRARRFAESLGHPTRTGRTGAGTPAAFGRAAGLLARGAGTGGDREPADPPIARGRSVDMRTAVTARLQEVTRATARDVLYMAALAAMGWNPAMGRFHQRLMNAGRAHKVRANEVALVAVMRSLVIPANALPRDGCGWSGAPPAAAP